MKCCVEVEVINLWSQVSDKGRMLNLLLCSVLAVTGVVQFKLLARIGTRNRLAVALKQYPLRRGFVNELEEAVAQREYRPSTASL